MSALIGGVVGACEICFTYPFEYTKTVMQLEKAKNELGAIKTIKETVSNRGFFGLYRGYSALLMFTVPKVYIRFGTFSFISNNILTEKTKFN